MITMCHFTIKEAAIEMGISVAVLRVWQVRYGWPTSVRKANGYRLYSESMVKEVREFCLAGRPFREIEGGVWWRGGLRPPQPEEPRPRISFAPSDDLEPRWVAALQSRAMGIVAFYLASLGRMRPAVRAQYVRSVLEADRLTGGAFGHLVARYGIEQEAQP